MNFYYAALIATPVETPLLVSSFGAAVATALQHMLGPFPYPMGGQARSGSGTLDVGDRGQDRNER